MNRPTKSEAESLAVLAFLTVALIVCVIMNGFLETLGMLIVIVLVIFALSVVTSIARRLGR